MRASELFDLADFQPVEAIEVIEDDHPRIRFSAKYLGESRYLRVKGAEYSITVDPEHLHRILIWEVTAPASIRYAYHIKYHDEKLHFPREIVYTIDTGGNRSEQTWTFELPKPCEIPDAEFYLPHYGISESVLETLHPNPWPRWLLIGFGILTIAIGAWLVRGRRQPAA